MPRLLLAHLEATQVGVQMTTRNPRGLSRFVSVIEGFK